MELDRHGRLDRGVLTLPARAQDCGASGDSYLYADGVGDVYGYSITYNICQDPTIAAAVWGYLYDPGMYLLDSGNDVEWCGNNAEVDTAATVFDAGTYYQYGAHEYYTLDFGWSAANPEYTEYTAWSDAPNQVPTVTSAWPDDSGGDPTWTPGGGPYSGAYEVAFSGADLTGQIPSVSDSGCSSAYSVAAWQTSDSQVWTTVSVLAYPANACYVSFALLGNLAQVLLSPQSPPPPPTISVSGNGEIWWLGGGQQNGWATSTVVTSSAGASTTWTTTSAAISLPNPATGASITVTPTGSAFSGRLGSDVPLTASAPGYTSKTQST